MVHFLARCWTLVKDLLHAALADVNAFMAKRIAESEVA
jgi:hypothetical protein